MSQGGLLNSTSGGGVIPPSGGGTGVANPTAHTIPIAEGAAPFNFIGPPTNGQTVIGSTGADPVVGTIGSSDGSITWTTGAGTLTAQGTAASTSQSGSVILATNAQTIAGASTTTVVTPSSLGAKLGTQTSHGVIIGGGSSGAFASTSAGTLGFVLASNGGAADPSFSAIGTNSGLTAHGVILGQANSPFVATVTGSANQLLASGGAAADPGWTTLTAGNGISITFGVGTATVAATGAGFVWNDATGATVTLAVENGYVTDRGGGVAYTLPATASLGDSIIIVGKLGAWSVAQNANQQILLGSSSSTVTSGSIASTNVGDCVEMVCITSGASTIWRVRNSVGNITVA